MSGSLVATPATAKARAKHRLNTTTTHQEKADEDNSVTHKTPDSTHRVNIRQRRKERKKQVEDKFE